MTEQLSLSLSPTFISLVARMVKTLSAMSKSCVESLGREDPLEKVMATYSSILAWRIPWTEEPGELQPMRSQMSDIYITLLHHRWKSTKCA